MNNTDICIINKSIYLSIYIHMYIYMLIYIYIYICFGFYWLPIHLIAIYPKFFVTVAAKETQKNSLSMGSIELVCRQKRPREQPGLQSFTKLVSLYWLFHRDPYNGSLQALYTWGSLIPYITKTTPVFVHCSMFLIIITALLW